MKLVPFARIFVAVFLLFAASNAALAQFTIGGSAASTGSGCYRLTSALNNQSGYVYQNASIDLNQPFDFSFSVYLGTNNGNGADGIVFVLRNSLGAPFIGTGGGLLGFNGSGFTNSLGVEVDTWQNGNFGDIVFDHIGIISQGSTNHNLPTGLAGPIQASATAVNIEDGAWHFLNVTWDPGTEELRVLFDCEERLLYTGNIIDSIFNGDSTVHWGFLGTTGGASNLQQFCLTVPLDSLVTSLNDTSICTGEVVQLNAGNSTPSYSWNNGGSLSSTTIPNPIAMPLVSTSYIVTATYACDTIIDTAQVDILPVGFTLSSTVTEPLCFGDCNGEIDLTVNGNGNYSYAWNTGPTTEDLTGLCQGTYTVVVSDSGGCVLADTVLVNQPALLQASILNATKTSCPGLNTCDASAEVQATGGTTSYAYLWSTGEDSAMAEALCPDSNFVTVTDANGCVATAVVDIDIPDSIVTVGNGSTQICISQSTVINSASIGGTPPFSYNWFEGSLTGTNVAATQAANVSPVTTKTYIVQSTDANGCVGDTSMVTIKVRPKLRAIIEEPDTICPYDVIDITAIGRGGDSNYTYSWSSGDLSATTTVSPDLSQWFYVTVSDICGTPSLVDSVFVQVGGYSPIKATIRADRDSICLGEETFIVASGRGGFRGPAEYEFKWLNTTFDENLRFINPKGTREYAVTISDLCLSVPGSDTITIHVNDLKDPVIIPSKDNACAKAEVSFTLSEWSPKYRYDWRFSDGIQFRKHQDSALTRSFDALGCFDVRLSVSDGFGCEAEVSDSCIVEILQQPIADFSSDKPMASSLDPFMTYRDKSFGAESITWFLDFSEIEDEEFVVSEVNTFFGQDVKLIAVAGSGCSDTVVKHFDYFEDFTIYMPNSFTPNGDGKNDVFKVEGESIVQEGFELAVYDRWGGQLFLSTNPNYGWDGKSVAGTRAPQGVYTAVLKYTDGAGDLKRVVQTLTISRTDERRF